MVCFRWFLLPVLFFAVGVRSEGPTSTSQPAPAVNATEASDGGADRKENIYRQGSDIESGKHSEVNASATNGNAAKNAGRADDSMNYTSTAGYSLMYDGRADDVVQVGNATREYSSANVGLNGSKHLNYGFIADSGTDGWPSSDTGAVEQSMPTVGGASNHVVFVNATGDENGEALGKSFKFRSDCRACPTGTYCKRNLDGYHCQCRPGNDGAHCKRWVVQTEPCSPNHCLNGGKCMPAGGSYNCYCVRPYGGSHCQRKISGDPCSSEPCRNGCECQPSCRHASGYYCRSTNGFLGKNCTIPPPLVECQPDKVFVAVHDSFVREYDLDIGNSRLYLAPAVDSARSRDCFSSLANHMHSFLIRLPFAGCGTQVNSNGPKTIVTNTIWLGRFTIAGDFDMPVPVVTFECSYQKEYSVVTTLEPAINLAPVVYGDGVHRVSGAIDLCKKPSSCPHTCPAAFAVTQGAIYTVGEWLHLNIRGDNTPREVLALRELHLSCGRHPSSPVAARLVSNGCQGSSLDSIPTKISHNGRGASICASFQVPRLKDCSVFYIHADVEICSSQGCEHGHAACSRSGRKRRSTQTFDSFDGIFGPIYSLDGSRGESKEFLFPDTSVIRTAGFINDANRKERTGSGEDSTWSEYSVYSKPVFVSLCVFCAALLFLVVFTCLMLHFGRRCSCAFPCRDGSSGALVPEHSF